MLERNGIVYILLDDIVIFRYTYLMKSSGEADENSAKCLLKWPMDQAFRAYGQCATYSALW